MQGVLGKGREAHVGNKCKAHGKEMWGTLGKGHEVWVTDARCIR